MTTGPGGLRRGFWAFLAAAILIAGWTVYTRRAAGTPPAPSATPVAGKIKGSAPATAAGAAPVSALGRLRPHGGVLRVAGPSQFAVVLARLNVDEGDRVRAGQILAVLDTYESQKANAVRLEAELLNADRQYRKIQSLYDSHLVSAMQRDDSETQLAVARANLARARADVDQSVVRAPIAGRVLKVHTHAGEKVGEGGILEIGRTDEMYAVGEVYETDIARIRVGERAVVRSPALETPLSGTVARIGSKVGKLDISDADPVARTDARIVEVEVRLDDSRAVAKMTNLQVEITFGP